MNKILLFIFFALVLGNVPGFAQIDPVLGPATGFAVLAATEVNNTGQSGVTGNVGVAPGTTINGKESISIQQGKFEINSVAAINARAAALKAYDDLRAGATTIPDFNKPIGPGTYIVNGDLDFNKVITLSSEDNTGKFVFIVNGNINTESANAAIRLSGVVTAQKVYWLVSGSVNMGMSTRFDGTVISKGNIVLNTGVTMQGRAISLEGSVTLNSANVYLPIPLRTDVGVRKPAPAGTYNVGDLITYTIRAYNNGPGTAVGVIVKENFPQAYLSYVSAEPSVGTFDTSTYPYKWNIGALQVGEEVYLKITFRIIGIGANGVVTNNVTIDSDDEDPKPEDNDDGDPVPVTCKAPTLAIAGETNLCNILNAYTYTVTEVVGAAYTFNVPAGWTEVSRAGNTITVIAPVPGTLKATVTDKCGNSYTTEKEVTPVPALGNLTIDGATEVCANSSSLAYTVNGAAAGVTYTWVATGGISIVSGATEKTVKVNVGENGGTLTVTAVNACGGISTETKTITIPATPVMPVAIVGNSNVCAGEELTYSVEKVNGAASYTWGLPNGWTFVGPQTGNTIKVKVGVGAVSGPVEITVEANSACGNSSTALSLYVTVSAKPAAPVGITAGSTGTCIGEEIIYSVTSPVAGATYQWTVPTGNGWEIIGDATGSSIRVKLGTTKGTITVAQVSEVCGAGAVASLSVNPSVAPVITGAITGKAEVCAGQEGITYTIPAIAGATYDWNLPDGWECTAGRGTNSITVTAGQAGGTFSVRVSNSCSTSAPVTFAVKIAETPAAVSTIKDNSNVCDGLVYTVDAVAGATSYFWSVPAGFTITEGQGTTTTKVKADSYTATGDVKVAVMNAAGCTGPETRATIDASKANGELNFPKAFSPNGDGTNDTWTITNLEKFPENEVVILNRWGSEVYKIRNYKNTWDGKGLANGTYFYKVKVKVCAGVEKEFTGYVTIFR